MIKTPTRPAKKSKAPVAKPKSSSHRDQEAVSPIGQSTRAAAAGRARGSQEYREARDEYALIKELRKVNPIAAHLRERRFELGLTQEEVARAAGTRNTNISRLEKGEFMPKLPTLQRIAAILDEELLVCFQHTVDGEVERDFAVVLA